VACASGLPRDLVATTLWATNLLWPTLLQGASPLQLLETWPSWGACGLWAQGHLCFSRRMLMCMGPARAPVEPEGRQLHRIFRHSVSSTARVWSARSLRTPLIARSAHHCLGSQGCSMRSASEEHVPIARPALGTHAGAHRVFKSGALDRSPSSQCTRCHLSVAS